MDATPILPNGSHPYRPTKLPDGVTDCHALRRIDHPVRYYFIDFGLSTRFGEGESPLVTGHIGAYARDIPELSSTVPYDAFAADVFTLGTVFRKELLDVSVVMCGLCRRRT